MSGAGNQPSSCVMRGDCPTFPFNRASRRSLFSLMPLSHFNTSIIMKSLSMISKLFLLISVLNAFSQPVSLAEPLPCQRPPAWTVDDNGIVVNDGAFSPMNETLGSVTLVSLMKGSSSGALQQASRLKSLLRVLRTMGLDDIKFMIINSQDASAPEVRDRLNERVNGSSIRVYQDSESSTLWNDLGGSRGEVLIYDRCGRLTYFIPNHLSILSPKKPIVQTTILSAYFDNPCGRSCDVRNTPPVPDQEPAIQSSPSSSNETLASLETPQNDVDYNSTAQPLNLPMIVNASAHLEGMLANKSDEDTGSGEAMSLPWRIFDFFLSQVGHTSTTTVTPIVINETESRPSLNETLQSNSSLWEEIVPVVSNVTTITPITTTAAVTCDANQCREFSTDTILRARLCCLAVEAGQDGESPTSGCRTYSKQTCDQMMPLIKCCLKDFAELLTNFFNRQGSGSSSSSSIQRQRKASFAG